MSVIDEIISEAHSQLIPFNEEIIKTYRESQIKKSAAHMDFIFNEITKLTKDQIKYEGYRLMYPEERVSHWIQTAKPRSKNVDILHTELSMFDYVFEADNQKYHSYMFLPFLRNDAITMSGSKYYIQNVIGDNLFFYIQDGVGLKVIRGPIMFMRNLRYTYQDVDGNYYNDDIITTQVHFKKIKLTKKNLATTLLLYILIYHGFYETCEIFGVKKGDIDFSLQVNEDDKKDYAYFKIRGVVKDKNASVIPTPQDLLNDTESFYLRVKRSLLREGTIGQRRLIASLMYNMSYFDKCNSTMYQNNEELIHTLRHTDMIYKIIIGKTTFGMDETESRAHNYANQHWENLDESYIDAITQRKFRNMGLEFTTTHELFVYMFEHIDEQIVGQSPMCLYGKKLIVNEILFSGTTETLFKRVYDYTKHNRPLTSKELFILFKAGTREIMKISKHNSLVRLSVQFYNDNWLLTIGGKKIRATGSGSGNIASKDKGKKKPSKSKNAVDQIEYAANSSMFAVESINSYPTQNPGASGTINPHMCIENLETGIIIKTDFQKPLDVFDTFVSGK